MPKNQIMINLCKAAVEFRDLACWEWMDDTTVFAIENPNGGPTGYCSVMGHAGEFTALGVYLGDEGWSCLAGIFGGAFDGQAMSAQFYQTCLMASFEDRGDLHESDRALLKVAGIKPRGRGAWPIFRSHRPGYVPWYLEDWEAEFLMLALQQAAWVGKELLDKPEHLIPGERGTILTRSAKRRSTDAFVWRTEWKPVPQLVFPDPERPAVDPETLADLRDLNPTGPWVYDVAWLVTPIGERGERPKYPRLSFCLALGPDLIIDANMLKPHGYADDCVRHLAERMRGMGFRPTEWLVRSETAARIIEPIAQALEISIHMQDHLPELDRALNEMLAYSGLQ